jgi:hypothetical protein
MGDTMSGFVIAGNISGAIELAVPETAGTNTLTLPARTGTVITSADTGSVTNGMLAGSISNDKLANSTITIGGQSVALGGSIGGVGATGAVFDVTRTINNDQTLNGLVKVTNLTVRLDSNNSFSTGLSRFTPNVAGYYFISAKYGTGGFVLNASPYMSLYKNGTEVFNSTLLVTNANASDVEGARSELRGYVLMNGSTDYLELYMYANQPGGGNWPRIQWSGHMVRAA